MQQAQYDYHVGIISRLAYMYDHAGDEVDAQRDMQAELLDFAATGSGSQIEGASLIARFQKNWNARVENGPEAMRSTTLSEALRYFRLPSFTDSLTHTPASILLSNILPAFRLDMIDDGQTFTTRSDTGVVHFLDVLLGEQLAWPQSDTPTLPDITFESTNPTTTLTMSQILTMIRFRG